MGGFSGANNTVRQVNLTLPQNITVDDNNMNPHIHIGADLLEMFESPNLIDFSKDTLIMHGGANAKKVADNYADMFDVIMVE